MTDLRALLGDRYGKTVPEACLAAAYGWHDATCPESRDCPSRDMHSASAPAVLAGIVGASALAALTAVLPDLLASPRDEYHTMEELYDYRMLYNAIAANAMPDLSCKSWRHSDGEECFGGGWFVVYMTLPSGQVSNHYRAEHWELFHVPEVERAPEYDGHTPQEAAERLRQAARDGQYVTAEHAANNPATTVREDDSRVRELQARLDAVVALARKWATQPTDWDEDTEQQIEDGTELLTLLGLTLEEQP